jgi:hypothetical protein
MSKLNIPEGYPSKPHRQVPDGAVELVERPSQDGRWIDLLAIMPAGAPIYVTTKPKGDK